MLLEPVSGEAEVWDGGFGWRAALVLFNNALAAVAAGAGTDDVTADFKAGKDL